ncbi:hypothetical protein V144x_16870 [Gimesia aquarii]|uniref:Uncharacterized protein n=1 Tax=Gimesia aquarii TaxID=2527964 RepID=A0A517VT93_9PLAN|nr:hypothetical protein V144x_16870 [Gimesia aquarii]
MSLSILYSRNPYCIAPFTTLADLRNQLDPLLRIIVSTMVNFGKLRVQISSQSGQTGLIWGNQIVLIQKWILVFSQKQRQTRGFYSAGINRGILMHPHDFFYSRARRRSQSFAKVAMTSS